MPFVMLSLNALCADTRGSHSFAPTPPPPHVNARIIL